MSVLEAKNVYFGYNESLLVDVNFRLLMEDHAVLIGKNGIGKSTLLKIIQKELSPDKGTIVFTNGIKIGYLDQYAEIDQELKVIDYINSVYEDLFKMEEKIQFYYDSLSDVDESTQNKYLNSAYNLQLELETKGFYEIKEKIDTCMAGVGLNTDIYLKKISSLSSGMREKLILVKLLLSQVDCMILDEPTNYLDESHINWLIKFLNNFKGSFLVVSHDEFFIKGVGKVILDFSNYSVTRYNGDYDFYLKEKILREETLKKQASNQAKYIEAQEKFINRFKSKATLASRAQSRVKMLNKIERIVVDKKDTTYSFNFPFSVPNGKLILDIDKLEIGYTAPLLDPIDFRIENGMKVAITGKNGIGKSTLIKTILNIIPKLGGNFNFIDTAEIVYYSEENEFDESYTAYQMVDNFFDNYSKFDIMSLLGSIGINYEKSTQKISQLSGGELSRLRLSLLKRQKSNILILDEPTNHLDFKAKEALKDALNDYVGTIILISHDKQFYDEICNVELELYKI